MSERLGDMTGMISLLPWTLGCDCVFCLVEYLKDC